LTDVLDVDRETLVGVSSEGHVVIGEHHLGIDVGGFGRSLCIVP
jgi:hypothetical protein